jgi:hypothetical protein
MGEYETLGVVRGSSCATALMMNLDDVDIGREIGVRTSACRAGDRRASALWRRLALPQEACGPSGSK